jgi:hypothetical protein
VEVVHSIEMRGKRVLPLLKEINSLIIEKKERGRLL